MALYRSLAAETPRIPASKRFDILLEIGFDQAKAVSALFDPKWGPSAPLSLWEVGIFKDLGGRDRVVHVAGNKDSSL